RGAMRSPDATDRRGEGRPAETKAYQLLTINDGAALTGAKPHECGPKARNVPRTLTSLPGLTRQSIMVSPIICPLRVRRSGTCRLAFVSDGLPGQARQ